MMSPSERESVTATGTLWTTRADPTVHAEFLRALAGLSDAEREALARWASEESKGPLRQLLRPYETATRGPVVYRGR